MKTLKNGILGLESFVLFRNSQGEDGRGTLIHITRNHAVFEVYNPFSIVQLSEVLQDLRIFRGERAIYSGRAVVNSLVPTGLMLIVSVTLMDPWTDLAELLPGKGLRQELERFMSQWGDGPAILPSYQLAVNRLRMFLGEISHLLAQVDIATDTNGSYQLFSEGLELFEEITQPIVPEMEELFYIFEEEARKIPHEDVWTHKAFVRHELHPLFLCSPYVHRIYTKPLGYAGDYEMVNMIVRNPFEGLNTYAKLINFFCLRLEPAKAHRNRIKILEEKLANEARKAVNKGNVLRVMNVGCGPAIEIQRFIRQKDLARQCEFHLLDFNEQTITHVREQICKASQDIKRKPHFHFIHKSIHQLLKEMAGYIKNSATPSFEMIYCAGLFDYLSDRVCKRLLEILYDWLEPGGLLIATNVHPKNPIRCFMEHLVEWYLIYRDESKISELSPTNDSHSIYTDPTGMNVFLEIRKPVVKW